MLKRDKQMSITTKLAVLAAPLVAALGLTGVAVMAAPSAHAYPSIGCETVHWGFLGSQLRTICDGPRQPDGSWERARIVWVPAHYVPFSCSSSTYSSSCSGGYNVGDTYTAKESYVVTPDTVLPDEPGWLPPGTDTLKPLF
jgi:hypothetical protein